MIVVTLVVVVLLQRSEGGALGVGGGGGFMTGRGQANALTRATAILAALFFATSIGLTVLARLNQAPEVIDQTITPIEPGSRPGQRGHPREVCSNNCSKMENQTSKPPALPPGMTLPGQSGPAAPLPAQACWKRSPRRDKAKLPLPALPACPRSRLRAAPAAPAQPLPYKSGPPASLPPPK